jgi:hypothetical protein
MRRSERAIALIGRCRDVAATKSTPSGICRRPKGGDPSGRIPLGGILLANKVSAGER